MKIPSARIPSLLTILCVLAIGAFSAQASMKDALAHLKKAQEEAKNASVDKGGHRAKAIKAIEAAIAEVEAGIAYDKENDSGNREGKKTEKEEKPE